MKRNTKDHENILHDLTADDATASACDIGCPTYLTIFLN